MSALPTSDELRAAIGPELQALARQAIEGKGPDLGAEIDALLKEAKLQQPKTVPLAIPAPREQVPGIAAPLPAAGQPAVATNAAPAAAAPEVAVAVAPAKPEKRESAKREVEREKPKATTSKPKSQSRTGLIALLLVGGFAVAAGGGAVWQAKRMQKPDGADARTGTEGSVKFVVPARAGENPAENAATAAAPSATATQAAAPTQTAAPTQPAATVAETKHTPPPEATPAEPAGATAGASETPEGATAKPARRVRGTSGSGSGSSTSSTSAASDEPKTRPSAAPAREEKKTASGDDKKPAPPPPAPAGGQQSVDAILQQQLKSAIP